MRGQGKNNADASDYGGRQNHQENSIFPTYLGMCNIHHNSMQSYLHLSLPSCGRADKHSTYVPEFGAFWSAPRHAFSISDLPPHILIAFSLFLPPNSLLSSTDITLYQTFPLCSLQPRAG